MPTYSKQEISVILLMFMTLRALDLFCGAGGASMGLHRAGFEVVGVDIKPQPHYPFEFHQAEALTFPLEGHDLIWASPPCQFGSEATPMQHRLRHENLIPATRARLQACGTPYIIENVEAVRKHLIEPVLLCGTMFGLPIYRHRYFELSWQVGFLVPPCKHDLVSPGLVTRAGSHSRALDRKLVLVTGSPGRGGQIRCRDNTIAEKREAMQVDWMVEKELTQAIPPAYSEWLARQFLSVK